NHPAASPLRSQPRPDHTLSSLASAIAPATRIIWTHNSKRRKSSSRAISCSSFRHSFFTSSSSIPDVSPSMATRTGAETTNARLSPNRNLVSTLPSFLYITSLIFITQSPLRLYDLQQRLKRHHDQPRPAIRPKRKGVLTLQPRVKLFEPIFAPLALPPHPQPDHVARVAPACGTRKRHPLTADELGELPLGIASLPLTPPA